MGTRKKKTTRGRSDHPGVKLLERRQRSGRRTWQARWEDPRTGRPVSQSLTALGLRTREARKDWAKRKAASLATEKAAIAAGERPAERLTFQEAVDRFFDGHGRRLAESTRDSYRETADALVEWAAETGPRFVEELNGPRLAAFRDYLANRPKRRVKQGAKRGVKATGRKPRSGATVNRDLRSAKAIIRDMRRLGFVTISRDDIGDALRPVATEKTRPKPLKADEITDLLEACERHDTATFEATRAELAGKGTPGTTPCHSPITPLVRFVLLTGCRLGEALNLRWDAVDLDAHGAAGEVVIEATACKTRTERAVLLDKSPSLRALLASLRLAVGGEGWVFGGTQRMPETAAQAARKRLVKKYGAPSFNWQQLRQTCGSYLTNAPGIYGGSSAYMSARRLGHSVAVAESHYLGLLGGIDPEARTLEQAMGIEPLPGEAPSEASPAPARERGASA